LKNGELSESEEKKKAIQYLEEAKRKEDDFIHRTIAAMSKNVGKEELIKHLKDNWFRSYKLRMAITGRKIELPANQPQHLANE
jgi:hypothetical protein